MFDVLAFYCLLYIIKDIMVDENKNPENFIKDVSSSLTTYKDETILLGFNKKANKLITALYMVTDIIDRDEPLRNKLRILGAEILSDIYSFSYKTDSNLISKNVSKINELLSFLEIVFIIRMISEMNHRILKKEFTDLKDSFIKHDKPILIEEFLNEIPPLLDKEGNEGRFLKNSPHPNSKNSPHPNPLLSKERGRENSIGRIGVQKGDTLLRALKDIKQANSGLSNFQNIRQKSKQNSNKQIHKTAVVGFKKVNFDNLKKERRIAITKIIKDRKQATITDIKMFAFGPLVSCGEKTLQRELISMVNDGVLKKMGEKRWSKYFL
ncbi:MAG: hypothetical protein ABH951_00130 [Patescibacteria group bacterium]